MAESDMEQAWLYHEIGRCHLELNNYDTACDFGKKSFEFAHKMEDDHWKLNATVLIAQSLAKMNDAQSLEKAIEHFEKAVEIAEKQDDEAAIKAIKKALDDTKIKLSKVQSEDNNDDDEDKKDKDRKVSTKSPENSNNKGRKSTIRSYSKQEDNDASKRKSVLSKKDSAEKDDQQQQRNSPSNENKKSESNSRNSVEMDKNTDK
jgi:tetratricopeptide (TPR) repeat protein